MGGRGGTASGRRAAARGAGGIFGKAADDLFRLSKKDGKRVDFLRSNSNTRRRPSDYGLAPRPSNARSLVVKSKRAGPAQQDLMDAVDSARRRNKDTGGNYAAFRYIDKNGNEGILVSRSGREVSDAGDKYRMGGPHSERNGGAFLLDQQKAGNVREVLEVYTERSPCDLRGRWCDEWLYKQFQQNNSNFEVTHREQYGPSDAAKTAANSAILKHARSLLK